MEYKGHTVKQEYAKDEQNRTIWFIIITKGPDTWSGFESYLAAIDFIDYRLSNLDKIEQMSDAIKSIDINQSS